MTDAINTNNRPQGASVSGEHSAAKGSATGNTSSPAQSNQSAPSTIVELSSTNLFEKISEQIDKLPEVNESRVALIKQSLEQGQYRVNAEVTAQKFSEIEQFLP